MERQTIPRLFSKLTRRRILQIGTLGCLGSQVPAAFGDRRRPPSERATSADACIIVFLNGGPSHLDMWDMKPDAASAIRGEFQPIASSLSGVQVCEHLPRLAKLMHRATLVRSVRHSVNNAHALAVYTALTGHDRGDANMIVGAAPSDYPCIGSVAFRQRPPDKPAVPAVTLPYLTREGASGPPQPGFFGGWLGRAYDPLYVLRDPNAKDFSIPEIALNGDMTPRRLEGRKDLLRQMDRAITADNAGSGLRDVDGFRSRAFSLLASPAVQRAFRLDREPLNVRDAYGRNIYGQSVLLARRLVEAGTRVVTISWAPDANATWDTHGQNFRKLKTTLLPQLDAAVSSLLSDLIDRRRLERTLVVVMGEFGRTPKINANAGRDHWNYCYSLLMAGGGIRAGSVFGSSDKIGAQPKSSAVGPADIVATIYRCLGISHSLHLVDQLNRPLQLVPWGDPINELLA